MTGWIEPVRFTGKYLFDVLSLLPKQPILYLEWNIIFCNDPGGYDISPVL